MTRFFGFAFFASMLPASDSIVVMQVSGLPRPMERHKNTIEEFGSTTLHLMEIMIMAG